MTARVLIVDGSEPRRSEMMRLLADEFFEAAIATAGGEALLQAQRDGPDLVLLGAATAGLNPFEICRSLKADPATAHVPVVMITAHDAPAARLQGLAVGVDDFLVEPVSPPELFARVRSLVRLKALFDEIRAREATGDALGLTTLPDAGAVEDRATIALVDDSGPHVGELILTLCRFGTVATVAADRALDRLRKVPCDLVVIGLTQGRVDGLRLISRLRSYAETRRLPVLAIVGRDDGAGLVKAFDLGASDCVKYPADMLEVTARVRTLLRRKRLTERMRQNLLLSMRLAITDAVTGLFNRHYLMHHLATLIARTRGNGRPLAALMVDIDHFKRVNDTHGHAAGDAALHAVGHVMAEAVRGVDLVARYGGEEFVVIMPDSDLGAARLAADRIRLRIANLHEQRHNLPPLSASIGVAELAESDVDAMAFLARADTALYAAKQAGRNCVAVAEAKLAAA